MLCPMLLLEKLLVVLHFYPDVMGLQDGQIAADPFVSNIWNNMQTQ